MTLLIESTLNFAIVFQMQLRSDKMEQIKSEESSLFSHQMTLNLIFIAVLFAVIVPLLILRVACQKEEKLRSKEFEKTWFAVYGQFKIK